MILTLDIGNTSVSYGLFRGKTLIASGSELCIHIPKIFEKWQRSGKFKEIVHIVISSVVPKNTRFIKKAISSDTKVTPFWIAGENLPVPIKSKYRRQQLGIDRAVNIYGALSALQKPFLVIDFGTAVTFDYVSKNGIFEGGLIVPGPETAFQALIEKAALLPKKMRLPHETDSFLGRNTMNCLKSGILQGYGSMTDELIRRFKKRFGLNLKVLATGGFVKHLKPYIKEVHRIDPLHTLKSLHLLYCESNLPPLSS